MPFQPRLCTDEEFEENTVDLGKVDKANMYMTGGMTGDWMEPIPHDFDLSKTDVEREKPPYNCLGWVLHNAPKSMDCDWVDLENDLEAVATKLERQGYVRASPSAPDAEVDIIGESKSGSKVLCHVIMKFRGPYEGCLEHLKDTEIWESKLDGMHRVTHQRSIFPNDSSKKVVMSFTRGVRAVAAAAKA